jgi:hypothetical protein
VVIVNNKLKKFILEVKMNDYDERKLQFEIFYETSKGKRFNEEEKIFLCDYFEDELDWNELSINGYLSERFIRRFKDKLVLKYIVQYQALSLDFLNEFEDEFEDEIKTAISKI